MAPHFTISLLFMFAVCKASVIREDYCYSADEEPYRLYSTKTAYETVRNSEIEDDEDECQASGFYFFSRHGTRHTGDDTIAYFREWFPRLLADIENGIDEGELCEADLQGLRDWELRMVESDDKELAESGWQEFIGIGQRYKRRFPDLLGRPYDPEQFAFRYTDASSNRTIDTARAFSIGLFETYDGVEMNMSPDPDYLLQYYKLCPKYDALVGDYDVEEQVKFMEGPEMEAVITRVSGRLGLDYTLTYDEIDTLFENCRVEYGIYNDAPWCAVFTREDLRVLEYNEDIKYYFEDSYPYQITIDMTCPVVQDFMEYFESVRSGVAPALLSRYGHSANLNTMLTRFGLFRPSQNLTADNYLEMRDGNFRSSLHTPMGSNIAMVIYSCENETYRVKTLVNEYAVQLPGCDSVMCDYEQFSSMYKPVAENCDFDEICRWDGSET